MNAFFPIAKDIKHIKSVLDFMSDLFNVPIVSVRLFDKDWLGEYIEAYRFGHHPSYDQILLADKHDMCTALHEFAHHVQYYLYDGDDIHGYTFTLALNRVINALNKHFPCKTNQKYLPKTFR